jgi:hypothetical protein
LGKVAVCSVGHMRLTPIVRFSVVPLKNYVSYKGISK